MNRKQLTEKHSFVNDTVFRVKTMLLQANRGLKNWGSHFRRFDDGKRLNSEPVIAFSESDLWNIHDNKDNWMLTAGKIENLRIASRQLNGLEVKANEVFSFWKHIGNPNFGKGYVVGREIREGCIVPTIAGGLCQLSNALYDAALKANFDIIERHKHTRVIKGSLAEQDRDATVKWNYIDLCFKSPFDFRIEVELTSEKLVVAFRALQGAGMNDQTPARMRQSSQLNDCYSCGNFACYKHPDKSGMLQEMATTTFILDEKWPEFDTYVGSIATDTDRFILPLKKGKLVKTARYTWSAAKPERTSATFHQGYYRALKLRYAGKKKNLFELSLQLDEKIARAAAAKIPVESTHLIISQNLLPFVYSSGALGGRTYDVLMTRLPMEKLHERLDHAHTKYPDSPTLKDFRAPQELVDLENKALTRARKIITTHTEIAGIFKNKVEKLDWHVPARSSVNAAGRKILFPASALGRKGAYEMRQLARELHLELSIAGNAIEKDNFWEGIKVEKFGGDYNEIGLVVYPTYVEHQPRQVLKAIAKGIPVITTNACGLEPSETVSIVDTNDFDSLKNEVQRLLKEFK